MSQNQSMTSRSEPALGLRERKKIKHRRTIQAGALRLFGTQGYEQATVEQIAEAAETSTTTFYRYYPTKEDVVLDDDYDPLVETAFTAGPAEESLSGVIPASMNAVAVEAERDTALARLRLTVEVLALMARFAAEQRRTKEMFARLMTERTGRDIKHTVSA